MCFDTESSWAKTVYLLQGMWAEEKSKNALLETELKEVREQVVQERHSTRSMRLQRDTYMTAEAKYIERARVLEAANYENKQMIRDHAAHVVARVDDNCERVDAGGARAVKEAVEKFGASLLSRTESLLTDKLQTFGAIVEEVLLCCFVCCCWSEVNDMWFVCRPKISLRRSKSGRRKRKGGIHLSQSQRQAFVTQLVSQTQRKRQSQRKSPAKR